MSAPPRRAAPGDPGLPEPFAIGLRPVAEAAWLRPDARLLAYRAEKRRLTARSPGAVFAALPGTGEAQAEALALVTGWLRAHAPDALDAPGALDAPDAPNDPNAPDRPSDDAPPLLRAGLMLCEDLALMRRSGGAWVLAAGSIHFPSAWRLGEKIGRPLHEVHAPVPGFEAGTRGAAMIERIFDALAVGTVVERANWSLHDDDALHLPANPPDHDARLARADPGRLTVRRERQTLRKLPGSGDMLFTIDVDVPRLGALTGVERAALARQLRALDRAQRVYKGLERAAAPLAAALSDGQGG